MSDLIPRLRTLRQSYEEGLITNEEYNDARRRELERWSGSESKKIIYLIYEIISKKYLLIKFITFNKGGESERSFWGRLWDKACDIGSSTLRIMINPIISGLRSIRLLTSN